LNVAVTGGNGRIGRYVVSALRQHGHSPVIVDSTFTNIDATAKENHGLLRRANLLDLGETLAALEGCQAVVHLAAIAHPLWDSRPRVFIHNTTITINVLEAARLLSIKRVVAASSESTLGLSFAYQELSPSYFPIDESHPLRPQDPYGLSKLVGEQISTSYESRGELETVNLRFCRVAHPETYPSIVIPAHRNPGAMKRQLWSYVDVRDAAQACRLAVEAPAPTTSSMYIAAKTTYMNIPTRKLMKQFFPNAEDRASDEGPYASPLSTEAARLSLGWEAKHCWADYTPGISVDK